uniref:RRM domain-containing protein n=1 Tax=Arundo donax TaxID=35708 RepID=A0A0A9CU44_ARUDO
MAPIGRRREKRTKRSSTTEKRINKKSKKRPSLRGGGNWQPVIPFLPKFKFMRFFRFQEMAFLRRRKGKKVRQQELESVNKTVQMKQWVPMKEPEERSGAACFWRDPDAKFCTICGDDEETHLELKCPYNYLSPAAYTPCRARLALWGNYTTTLRYKCRRHKEEEQREPPRHDETNSRRIGFLRCLVRVNNLPEQCHPEELAALFSRFGPLRMWHVATRSSRRCKGYGCVVFQHPEHGDKAIEALNCRAFGDRKLRVDWAYPCLHY